MKLTKASFMMRELCASHKAFVLVYFYFQTSLKIDVQLLKVDLQKQEIVKIYRSR